MFLLRIRASNRLDSDNALLLVSNTTLHPLHFSEAFSGSVDKFTVDHERRALPAISEGVQQQQRAQGFPSQRVCGIH